MENNEISLYIDKTCLNEFSLILCRPFLYMILIPKGVSEQVLGAIEFKST